MTDTKSMKYYDENSQHFIESTLQADMSEHYEKFLKFMKPGDRILDAGCGTGRDTKAFLEKGYRVSAFDGSKKMVEFASSYTGILVEHTDFLAYSSNHLFDGIWACASLLHIGYEEQLEVLKKYHGFLKACGVFYMSFKYGHGVFEKEGRRFFGHGVESLRVLIQTAKKYEIKEMYITNDVRQHRLDQKWISVILEKR